MKKKPLKKAAALRYQAHRDESPRVVAKGRGKIAEKIIALAKEHQVPIVSDHRLAGILDGLDVETQIPAELYRAVAEVLAFVYRMDRPGEHLK